MMATNDKLRCTKGIKKFSFLEAFYSILIGGNISNMPNRQLFDLYASLATRIWFQKITTEILLMKYNNQ